MGAHTLGQAYTDNSGFTGYWTEDVYKFNNNYFINMYDKQWIQYKITSTNKIHWELTSGTNADEYNMLNTDISLLFDINNYLNITNGYVNCVVNKGSSSLILDDCPINTDNEELIIEEYVESNNLFIINFKSVWTKLITTGYDKNEDLYLVKMNTNNTTPSPLNNGNDGNEDNSYTQKPTLIITIIAMLSIMYHY